ncbi:MAG: alpha/beta fold hydrolase [Acidimicrobiales bacterium]
MPHPIPGNRTPHRPPAGLHIEDRPAKSTPDDDADDTIVVLVHGSLDGCTSFNRVLRRMPDVHAVIYDRRGYRRSRAVSPPALTIADHVNDLLAVIAGRTAVLAGHSYGATISLGAALAQPETVSAVAAYEPPLSWLDWWPVRGSPEAIRAQDPASFAEGFFRRMVSDDIWNRLPEPARAERRADGPALVAELSAIREPVPPFDPCAVRVPAVIGYGSLTASHHRRAAEELAGCMRDARLFEIAGAGHGAHLTHPDRFAAMVKLALQLGEGRRA